MKEDIQSRADLYLVVNNFYSKLLKDDLLFPFFEKFTDSNVLETHLQELVGFWDNSLFYSGGYRKNVLQIHLDLHRKMPISKTHINHWLSVFNNSVDELFQGENSHKIKSRAKSIAVVMEIQFSKQHG